MSNNSVEDLKQLSAFEKGVIVGVLIGEGYFGGDGKYPAIVIKMHVRHKPLFNWLLARIPGSRLYGPYLHDKRNYYMLMIRGAALADMMMYLVNDVGWQEIDTHSYGRIQKMLNRYVRDGASDTN